MPATPNQNVRDGAAISDPIDRRVYLTDAQFRSRVLKSHAWADYLTLPPIAPFDEPAALAEIAQRNAVRAESSLPLIDARQELERLKEHYEERTAVDRFYALASECVAEIYGPIKQGDFNSMSSLRGFMAGKQNIIHDLIQEQGGSVRRK